MCELMLPVQTQINAYEALVPAYRGCSYMLSKPLHVTKTGLTDGSHRASGKNCMPPPLTPCLAIRHFSGRGWGCKFSGSRVRNLIPPRVIQPPPLQGYLQGLGGGGGYKIWARKRLLPFHLLENHVRMWMSVECDGSLSRP